MIENKYGKLEYPPGSTAQPRYDMEGNEITLLQLVQIEPSWAVMAINHQSAMLNRLLEIHLYKERFTEEEKEYFLNDAALMLGYKIDTEK